MMLLLMMMMLIMLLLMMMMSVGMNPISIALSLFYLYLASKPCSHEEDLLI